MNNMDFVIHPVNHFLITGKLTNKAISLFKFATYLIFKYCKLQNIHLLFPWNSFL